MERTAREHRPLLRQILSEDVDVRCSRGAEFSGTVKTYVGALPARHADSPANDCLTSSGCRSRRQAVGVTAVCSVEAP